MAQRGMLPKFRPAAVGGATARPTIRPVRPGPPPPPPAPPRKIQSGVAARRGREPEPELEVDPPTAAYPEPPTQASYAKRQANFDDETQARPEEDPYTARRQAPVPQASRETRDEYPSEDYGQDSYQQLQGQRDDYPPPSVGDMNVPYDALPSLAVQRPFDEYDREFVDRDPAAQVRAARESARMERAQRNASPDPEPTRREGSSDYEQSYEQAQPQPQRHGRAQVGSGARERPITQNNRNEASGPQRRDAWNGMRTAAYEQHEQREQAMIPPPPRMPEDAPPGFVMGVQPVRQLDGPMFPPALAPRPAVAQQMFQPHVTPVPMGGIQPMHGMRPMTPPHGAMALPQRVPTGPVMAASAYVQSAHKGQAVVSAQSLSASGSAKKTGRFAWFVFGSAFGIAFAFFATGFAPKIVGGAGHKDESFPPAPPPAMTAPAQQQQPGQMMQPGQMQQPQQLLPPGTALPPNQLPPSGTMMNPSFLPSANGPGSALGPPQTMGTLNGQSVPQLPATGTQTTAPAPRAGGGGYVRPTRPNRPSRPSAPPRAPRGGGDDDVPASREGGGNSGGNSGGGSPGDILGDALK